MRVRVDRYSNVHNCTVLVCVLQCDQCKSVYHKNCVTKTFKCPKCERRQRYQQQQAKSAARNHGDVVNYTLQSDDHVRMPSAV